MRRRIAQYILRQYQGTKTIKLLNMAAIPFEWISFVLLTILGWIERCFKYGLIYLLLPIAILEKRLKGENNDQ
ncbi:hypothetical protein AB6M97_01925 [Streptococcus hillyeri]|uniref:hypothetical protein n=1 Tax=Streptococcus hillyeri TaxID=2282420 RepID=UPI0034E2630E